MNNSFDVYVTFDIDFADYTDQWKQIDEFEVIQQEILPVLKDYGIPATWFVRIDNKMEADYGAADYLMRQYGDVFEELKEMGHAIGWHPHIYKKTADGWHQEIDEEKVLQILNGILPYARKYQMNYVRMGWGYQTNRTMSFFDMAGFLIDSSAIPRPRYPWEETVKDWTVTPQEFYRPSKLDYRVASKTEAERLGILEVPMTTLPISSKIDQGQILRYCNLSFKNENIRSPVREFIESHDSMVCITHPYELTTTNNDHHIISFNISTFCENIDCIMGSCSDFKKKLRFNNFDNISV